MTLEVFLLSAQNILGIAEVLFSYNNHILATLFKSLEKAKQLKKCAKYGRYIVITYEEIPYLCSN